MLWLMPADLVPGKDRHVPMDTHGKTSALETIRRPLAGQRGSGKCGNPLGCRCGRCSGNAVAGAVGVAESAETPSCHPERSEGPFLRPQRPLAVLGVTVVTRPAMDMGISLAEIAEPPCRADGNPPRPAAG